MSSSVVPGLLGFGGEVEDGLGTVGQNLVDGVEQCGCLVASIHETGDAAVAAEMPVRRSMPCTACAVVYRSVASRSTTPGGGPAVRGSGGGEGGGAGWATCPGGRVLPAREERWVGPEVAEAQKARAASGSEGPEGPDRRAERRQRRQDARHWRDRGGQKKRATPARMECTVDKSGQLSRRRGRQQGAEAAYREESRRAGEKNSGRCACTHD